MHHHPDHRTWWRTTQRLYQAAFGSRDPEDLSASLTEWTAMPTGEQGFTLAHLLYLQLEATHHLHRQMAQWTRRLSHIERRLEEGLEALEGLTSLPEESQKGHSPISNGQAPTSDIPETT